MQNKISIIFLYFLLIIHIQIVDTIYNNNAILDCVINIIIVKNTIDT